MNKLALLILLFILPNVYSQKSNKPNVILIMTDDMGAECLETYGAGDYKTPNLTKLAKEGMQFNHAYANPLCTPSRVKIMTGRYNFRNYTKFKDLDKKEITFGHLAKKGGYNTGIAGKWQLNTQTDADFQELYGFDTYCLWYLNHGVFGSRYKNPKLVQDNKIVEDPKGNYGPDHVNQFAIDFIKNNAKKDKPFFLYYPMMLPHFPFVPTPDSEEWTIDHNKDREPRNPEGKKKFYVDMVQYLDKLVGYIQETVKKEGIEEETLIMFTSDNGTYRKLSSTMADGSTFDGGKGKMWNNGTWVPFIAKWKNKIQPGIQTNVLVDHSDYYATLAEIFGVEFPQDRVIDGKSFLARMTNNDYTPRDYAFVHFNPKWGSPHIGNFIRTQDYKLYGNGEWYKVLPGAANEQKIDKSKIPAEIVEKLEAQMQQYKSEGSVVPVSFNPKADGINTKTGEYN